MNVVLFGPPGSGKGTQAVRLASELGVPHVATGDIFRRHLKERSELGVLARGYMDRGQLVPDQVTCDMVETRIGLPDCAPGVLLDGFPRSVAQARWLLNWWDGRGAKLDKVVSLVVADQAIVERLSGRRSCVSCGATYHIVHNPPGERCQVCGGEVVQRNDDRAEVVQERLETYRRDTAPVLGVLAERVVVQSVDGVGTIDAIYARIWAALS